jgi:nucleotide-binding universal stress UspA family protein
MFKHIMIATDGSELAAKAVSTGLALAKAHGAKVTIITVTEPRTILIPDKSVTWLSPDEYDTSLATAANVVLSGARGEGERHGLSCATVHVPNEFPAEAILKEAQARNCDLIVMASHGRRGMARWLLGGETLRVVTHSSIPILVCR